MKWPWLVLAAPLAYQVLAIAAAVKHLKRRRAEQSRVSGVLPPVSILKPLRGLDPNTYEAFVSQVQQDYPQFEILFGVRDPADAAAEAVRHLQREFPDAPIQLVIGAEPAVNGKVGVLLTLARRAAYPVWVVNDSDIRVGPDYLKRIVAPLASSDVGIVTCLYRAMAHTPAATWEALGIATDFMPSTMVAQLLGVREFGLGSTLCFRAADLEKAGGFSAIADYLADDYQLARRITRLGKRAVLSGYTVETSLADATWIGVWRHQQRWARTIRASKGRAYAGLPIAQAGIWMAGALAFGAWAPALCLGLVRVVSAYLTGRLVLESTVATRFGWCSPVWDLYSFAVWAASFAGREVAWRDRRFTIAADGRIRQTCG